MRPLVPATDADELFRLTHDDRDNDTWAEMKVGPFPSPVAFREHVDELVADATRAFFAITREDARPLGWLCLMEVQPAHRTVEVGYVVFAPELQRTTPATEAFCLIMTHVFDDLAFQRLEWTCTASNMRSRKAAARLGFQFEGVMRRKLTLKGRATDIAMYSMLPDEWLVAKTAMRRWLDPSNFTDGRQIEPLKTSRLASGA